MHYELGQAVSKSDFGHSEFEPLARELGCDAHDPRVAEVPKAMAGQPPQRHEKTRGAKTMPPHFYVVLDGQLRVATGESPGPLSTIALYRNLGDLRDGSPMEPGVQVTAC